MEEIAFLDKSQREELDLVRQAELNHVPQEIQNDLLCSEKLSDGCSNVQNGEFSEAEDELPPSPQDCRIDISSPGSAEDDSVKEIGEPVLEDIEEEIDQAPNEPPMDWEDLTREQWSESDRLLQKVERVGSKVLQRDFMSTVGEYCFTKSDKIRVLTRFLSISELVHVSQYKRAEEALAQRKLKAVQGKKVITTGPWQMIDIPTKVRPFSPSSLMIANFVSYISLQVSNRRCNYLTGLHVTIRQKDPKRAILSTNSIESSGVKTRHHDSRGSSRTSSRASSPIYQTESQNGKDSNSGSTKQLRSIKTRATKCKKTSSTSPSKNNNNNHNQSTKTATSPSSKPTTSTANSSNKSDETVQDSKNNGSRALEPCVTYTVVDGVPHFKVFFPSSKDSITSPAAGGFPKTATNGSSPRASIVESDIEIIQTDTLMENGSSPRITPERKMKPSSKLIKRPRLSHQGFGPSPIKQPGTSGTETMPVAAKVDDPGNKEELGRCIEKCGSWMGAPHFKFYRTFPSVNSTVASSNWSGSANSTVTTVAPKPVVIAPAPKLSSPITTPKLVIAPNKSATAPLPAMPKLTIGNQALKSAQSTAMTPPINPHGGKFVPIAPKAPNLTGGVSNFVIVPFADKNHANPASAIKRPISLLKTCPPLSNSQNPSPTGTFLTTVKNLKECLQNNKHQYKDVKVVVQKVAPTSAATGQQAAPRLADSDDLKKKVVKLFPSTDNKEQAGDEPQHLASPTVIVADMSI